MIRRNAIITRHRCQPLISHVPGSAVWILLVVLTAAVLLPFAKPPVIPRVEAIPPPVSQVETRISTQGYDSKRRSLPFTVYVLTQESSWKMESTADLEGGLSLVSPELIEAVNQARDVFCVGTASAEGIQHAEEARAAQRARRLEEWLRPVILSAGRPHLFSMNAGQYVGTSEVQSSFQRKAIIIATGPHDDNVDLSEALTSGLEQAQKTSTVVYSLLHDYSRSKVWLDSFHTSQAKPVKTAIGKTRRNGRKPSFPPP